MGKTTLTAKLAQGSRYQVKTEQQYRELERAAWSDGSNIASFWLNERGPWILEGVTMVRALRKWLLRNPNGKPCDLIYWMRQPKVARSPGQVSMAKACETIWNQIRAEVERRGVQVMEENYGNF